MNEDRSILPQRIYWLAWAQMAGVGPILLDRLWVHFGDLGTAWQASAAELIAVEGWGNVLVEKVCAARKTVDLEKIYQQHTAKNPDWLTPADGDYPRLLKEIPTKPPLLYYRGDIDRAAHAGETPCIGIVGTRDPSDYGRKWTRIIARALTERGFTIVSGMAEGVDTIAHQTCLTAGGKTIAIVGTGVDRVYPPKNQQLYHQIQAQGTILSEYPAGTAPARTHFPARNRIIAGLCRATIVMEAPIKSGALITAHYANDFGRDVFVLPGSIDNANSIGCLSLLNRGAQPFLSAEHLLELLGQMPQLDRPHQMSLLDLAPSQPIPELSPVLSQILQSIGTNSTNFDTIVTQTNLAASIVSSSLLELELLGLVSQLPGMHYQIDRSASSR
jgi:DNA processing protein